MALLTPHNHENQNNCAISVTDFLNAFPNGYVQIVKTRNLKLSMPDHSAKCNHLLGVWDVQRARVSLGGLLLLIEDLQARVLLGRGTSAGICFVDRTCHSSDSALGSDTSRQRFCRIGEATYRTSPMLTTLLDIAGIDECYHAESADAITSFISKQSESDRWDTWPSHDALDAQGLFVYPYETTIPLQEYYRQHGHLPALSMKVEPLLRAQEFLHSYVGDECPIAVHLKNHSQQEHCSNARQGEWAAFFKECSRQYSAKFIVIGNEPVDDAIRRLPNVIVSQDHHGTLSRDLAIVQISFAFMGMASGPSNMAVFQEKPYLILKSPGHHPEQMLLELGSQDHFPFAAPLQTVLRTNETRDLLLTEFSRIYAHIKQEKANKG